MPGCGGKSDSLLHCGSEHQSPKLSKTKDKQAVARLLTLRLAFRNYLKLTFATQDISIKLSVIHNNNNNNLTNPPLRFKRTSPYQT